MVSSWRVQMETERIETERSIDYYTELFWDGRDADGTRLIVYEEENLHPENGFRMREVGELVDVYRTNKRIIDREPEWVGDSLFMWYEVGSP